MKEKLKAIQEKAMAAFQEAKEMKDIDDLKVKYLGKKGELTAILKEMGKLSAEERPIIGQMANDVRQNLEKMLDEAKNRLAAAEMALAGVRSMIPPDEVVEAMAEIGRMMPVALKETSDGGLARTPSGIAAAKRLEQEMRNA